jgi:hypothetical protein
MNINDLVDIAILAFGPRWKQALSRESGISRVQLWRYERGIAPLHSAAVGKIKIALREHLAIKRDRIARMIAVLDGSDS